MTRYGMAIDTKRCIGCNNCAMACKTENNLPNGVKWNNAITVGGDVIYTPAGEYPDGLTMDFYTLACQHCDNPACVSVCAVEATYRRAEDGIIIQDNELCIGCRLCVEACPYQVRTFYDEDPEWYIEFPMGDEEAPLHEKNFVGKCTFCVHRIDRGERPACVDICRAYARYFGDLDDPESEVSLVLGSRENAQLLPEMNTGPNVYLLT